jgi:hypothetical protein
MRDRFEGPSAEDEWHNMVLGAEPARQQWVLDPTRPTGFRLVDLRDPPMWPTAWSTVDVDQLDKPIHTSARPRKTRVEPEPGPGLIAGIVLYINGQIVIRVPRDERFSGYVLPFVVGDEHNAYEWAMALDDQHPYHPMWCGGDGTGVDDEGRKDLRITAIKFTKRPREIFKAIKTAYKKKKKIKPVIARDEEPRTDLTLLSFRRNDILRIARDLGADGEVIRMLMAERDQPERNEEIDESDSQAETDGDALTPEREDKVAPANGETSEELIDRAELLTRNKWPDLTKLPARDELLRVLRNEFGRAVNQDLIRKLRRRIVPAEIKKGGGRLHKARRSS